MQITDVSKILEKYLEQITNDPELSPKEKLEKIKNTEKSLHEYYEINKNYVNEAYTYCSKCDDYYLNRAFEYIYRDETRDTQVSGLTDPEGNRDPSNWKKIKYKVRYRECPKGHLKEVNKAEIGD